MKVVECVPNFSEGRRADVIRAIRDAAAAVADVSVLDVHADAVHHRMVLTFVGPPDAVVEAAFRSAAEAARRIDLTEHRGEHPRIGATDVIPFVPVAGVTMDECVALAHRLGERLGAELDLPVYLYGRAARSPSRVRLPHVRRGQFEGLRAAILTDPERAPDFGPARLGPAGATAVGARPFLVAYNVNLATGDLDLARRIAKAVRESSGGLPAVQALGMATGDPNVVQVSMNLLDTSATPLDVVFAEVERRAGAAGVEVVGSEVVGLVPLDVLVGTARVHVRAHALTSSQVVEARVLDTILAGPHGAGGPV